MDVGKIWRTKTRANAATNESKDLHVLHDTHILIHIYRVAQNKIPHRRICNISATSGLILKILEAA